jgi:hypothetical protein
MSRINISKQNLIKLGYKDLEDWLNKDKNHMYIGRNMEYYVKGAKQSKWHNPYTVKIYGRKKCIELFENYIINSELYNQLEELKGKTLGCYCKENEDCHGDVLLMLLENKSIGSV